MILTGENRRRKTRPSATLSTVNPTGTDLGMNPGLRGEKPASKRLSYGTARLKCNKANILQKVTALKGCKGA
jgi:hypothetical protein